MTVAAVASRGHLYAGIHAVCADSHLICGRLTVFAGIHYLKVGPVVALPRRSSGNLRTPPKVYAWCHEYLGVGNVECRATLEEKQVETVESARAIWAGKLETIPTVVRHLCIRHDFHRLLGSRDLCACCFRVEHDGSCRRVYDAYAECRLLAALGFEDGIGADMSSGEVDAIDECCAFGIVPVDVCVRALTA